MTTPRRRTLSKRRLGIGLALAPLVAAGGWIAYSHLALDRAVALPPALPGPRDEIDSPAGRLSYYRTDETAGVPLLLVHSINAAANAYEVRPLYMHYRTRRPVYAIDLPGFGFSERSDRTYTPRLMTDAIHAMVEAIRARHGGGAVDAVALSLSAEYLARAAVERPQDYRSLGLVSPTGFDARLSGSGPDQSTRGSDTARSIVAQPLWGRPLYDLLVSRPSMRFFLEKTWGSAEIDEGLFAYDQASAHQPGAEHAPFSFLSGHLFPADITRVYARLERPVWMVHGTRGDFVDYRHVDDVRAKPNWTVAVLPTGAFPHFERLADVTARYDAFLAGLGG
ncbi:alpha/beta fold hydrolase [Methylobacterium sp. Leaf466]|uniref:alpha/beta fold hydrolase n=1 Tax=Methylobacterium sp. Leaf466 TaxID=1736386 RepID=UPI000701D00F|nr:alpha/beta fold hydrolase [Methylobacterium sp. Leaf466]KQT78193.1 alpha/beta hydrolase [Methylobacterium sp. Leaf466]